jgi:hypothetical protein
VGVSDVDPELKAAPLRFHTVRLLAGPAIPDVWTSQRSRSLNLTVNSVLVQEAGLSATELDGRVVVLSLQAASYFDFNKVASEIWAMLSSPHRIGDILQKLSQHHEADIEVMTHDVMSFLQSLLTQRLVRIVAVEDAR